MIKMTKLYCVINKVMLTIAVGIFANLSWSANESDTEPEDHLTNEEQQAIIISGCISYLKLNNEKIFTIENIAEIILDSVLPDVSDSDEFIPSSKKILLNVLYHLEGFKSMEGVNDHIAIVLLRLANVICRELKFTITEKDIGARLASIFSDDIALQKKQTLAKIIIQYRLQVLDIINLIGNTKNRSEQLLNIEKLNHITINLIDLLKWLFFHAIGCRGNFLSSKQEIKIIIANKICSDSEKQRIYLPVKSDKCKHEDNVDYISTKSLFKRLLNKMRRNIVVRQNFYLRRNDYLVHINYLIKNYIEAVKISKKLSEQDAAFILFSAVCVVVKYSEETRVHVSDIAKDISRYFLVNVMPKMLAEEEVHFLKAIDWRVAHPYTRLDIGKKI